MTSTIQSSTSTILPERVSSSQPITHSILQTTKRISFVDEDKIEPWVIIIISASAAVVLVVVFILILLFICRRFVLTSFTAANVFYQNKSSSHLLRYT